MNLLSSSFPGRHCFIVVLCVIASLFSAGCARRVHFKAVDAGTGRGIEGAEVKLRKIHKFEYLRRNLDVREVFPTDRDGSTRLLRVTSNDEIYFDAPGYRGAVAGLVGHHTIEVTWAVPPAKTPWSQPRRFVTNANDVVTIPLLPLATGEEYGPRSPLAKASDRFP